MKTRYDNYNTADFSDLISRISKPLNTSSDLSPLMNYRGDATYVLFGEASHGTHLYYTWRPKISQRLIEEKGFSFITVDILVSGKAANR
jgi:erythromycin esterase